MEGSVNIFDVTDQTFEAEVVEASHRVPVVVDLWADWCAPCRTLGPILETLAEEKAGAFRLAKVDTERNPAIATTLEVRSIPDVRAFVGGGVVDGFVGALPEPAVREWLGTILPSAEDEQTVRGRAFAAAGDAEAAEAIFREVLRASPPHVGASVALGELLLESGRAPEAEEILRPILPDPQAERLLAAARVASWKDGAGDEPVGLAKRRAAAGEMREALDGLIGIAGGDENARAAILEIFAVLGDDPLVREYRPRLASLLF